MRSRTPLTLTALQRTLGAGRPVGFRVTNGFADRFNRKWVRPGTSGRIFFFYRARPRMRMPSRGMQHADVPTTVYAPDITQRMPHRQLGAGHLRAFTALPGRPLAFDVFHPRGGLRDALDQLGELSLWRQVQTSGMAIAVTSGGTPIAIRTEHLGRLVRDSRARAGSVAIRVARVVRRLAKG